MEFNLRSYIKDGLLLAIGNKPDYKIILASGEWLKQGTLLEYDLAEIEIAINNRHGLQYDLLVFELRSYIKKGLLLAIGNMPEYEIRLMSGEWFTTGVLLESDLAEIKTAINEQYENINYETV